MNFIADENIDRQIVDELRSCGHDVVYIAELDPGWLGVWRQGGFW